MSLRDRIRKRREDDDADMMLFIFPVLYLMDSAGGGEKKKRHTSEETGEVKVHRLLEGHVKNFKLHLEWNHTSSMNWQPILEVKELSLIQGSRWRRSWASSYTC